MKKIFTLVLSTFFVSNILNAQLTLTKAFNEAVIGDVNIRKGHDSVSVIPKNTGVNQLWDFSTLLTNTVTESATYTTVASVASGTAYPAATMTEFDGVNSNDFIKITASSYEFLGTKNPSTALNYTNSGIFATWPVSMGYSGSDTFAGSAAITTLSGTAIGTVATNATGTGTLQLPGGLNFTNVLQVQLTTTLNLNLSGGTITATVVGRQYMYYHGSQKFPILTVNYNRTSGAFTAFTVDILANNAAIAGIDEILLNSDFAVYPNPSTGLITIRSKSNSNVKVEILNLLGENVYYETISSGNQSLNLQHLPNGIYTLKISENEKIISTNKIIIQK